MITCPRCGRTSANPNDVREGYCGACHDWTSPPLAELLAARTSTSTSGTSTSGA